MSDNRAGNKWKRARNTGAILVGFAVLIVGIKALQIRALSNSGGSNGPPADGGRDAVCQIGGMD